MASLAYQLREFIDEIILNEIGDGSSKPYRFKKLSSVKYSFTARIGSDIKEDVYVDFQNLNEDPQFKMRLLQNIYTPTNKMYNVGYNILGNEFQFKKATLSVLLRIISTIVLIVDDFIKTDSPDLLFIIGTPRTLGGDDSNKKSTLYKAFVEKQLNKFPGYLAESRLDGFVVFKKEIHYRYAK